MRKQPALNLGAWRQLDGAGGGNALHLPARHLVTHGVVVGMTGSGKTGLVTVLIEEALSAGVPTIVVDVKGDLPNLLLTFPAFDDQALLPWLEPADGEHPDALARAAAVNQERRAGLARWSIAEPELTRFCEHTSIRVLSPGSSAGDPSTSSPRSNAAPSAGTPIPNPRAPRSAPPSPSRSASSAAIPIRPRAKNTSS